jgi:hypothetical protein
MDSLHKGQSQKQLKNSYLRKPQTYLAVPIFVQELVAASIYAILHIESSDFVSNLLEFGDCDAGSLFLL